ncbi:winged helix-turn-helix transcriptional regulator [Saccharopolyspora sp. TS4A08]|uniref:Winged helix-turn-helix transcriptional regulator n=2 Tax=Saccharopolyspora ipomoeae TaxID=3042027 RepID=A0ABT6PMY7_9PSEU|nr:winged helix-turn-helix transcriptional regulator [Saccharopolyspora sp. TS4A08]MDI2029371.1 winged helix-turn-helix transcriptional regulator [Saccharopolyspora sp. TS4A08]
MDGARAFTGFQNRTGIARNILTDRQRCLVEHGILDRQAAPSGRRPVYALTEIARDLFTVIVSVRQWGERHAFEEGRRAARSSTSAVFRSRSCAPWIRKVFRWRWNRRRSRGRGRATSSAPRGSRPLWLRSRRGGGG